MILQVPDSVLSRSNLSQQELVTEIAIVLFEKKVLSLKAASKMANIHWFEFQRLLADKNIATIQYDTKDVETDLQNLARRKK
ncbi:MAG: UPF0175 family protein [Chitinophagales bacterium]